jgi:radical SAM protein with 4Fe4S-binding SPASM domain
LILGSQIQKSPPYFINLEPTSFCNLKCIICSYDDSRPKGYLDKQTAELALRQAVDLGVTEVRFFLAGEPFFHPHLCEFIRSAKEKGLLTLIHTNGSFLPEDRARKVIDAGLDKISFSLDGEKAEEYESVRIGAKFDHTLNNVIRFLEIKKRKGGKFPLTTIQVIKLPSFINPDNITRTFRGIFRQLPVDEFLLLKPFVWPEQERREFNPAVGCKFYPCMIPWSSLSVGWDGRVFWCCGDLNGKGVLGDIHHNTLREIWNGETMMKIRRGLARGELEDLPLCRNCEALYHHHNPLFSDLRDYWRQIKRAFK